eukprot:TRINITY_DN48310_c0_g1_i1.p1 TRINITY_DN48310_c0_g1~~TRINITY_DN48310_c0_g1_i1.p1  ORF type:complete len:681 (-),score=54.73 TRINITY_DN48310_c0_g1_i1:1667-3709(-)
MAASMSVIIGVGGTVIGLVISCFTIWAAFALRNHYLRKKHLKMVHSSNIVEEKRTDVHTPKPEKSYYEKLIVVGSRSPSKPKPVSTVSSEESEEQFVADQTTLMAYPPPPPPVPPAPLGEYLPPIGGTKELLLDAYPPAPPEEPQAMHLISSGTVPMWAVVGIQQDRDGSFVAQIGGIGKPIAPPVPEEPGAEDTAKLDALGDQPGSLFSKQFWPTPPPQEKEETQGAEASSDHSPAVFYNYHYNSNNTTIPHDTMNNIHNPHFNATTSTRGADSAYLDATMTSTNGLTSTWTTQFTNTTTRPLPVTLQVPTQHRPESKESLLGSKTPHHLLPHEQQRLQLANDIHKAKLNAWKQQNNYRLSVVEANIVQETSHMLTSIQLKSLAFKEETNRGQLQDSQDEEWNVFQHYVAGVIKGEQLESEKAKLETERLLSSRKLSPSGKYSVSMTDRSGFSPSVAARRAARAAKWEKLSEEATNEIAERRQLILKQRNQRKALSKSQLDQVAYMNVDLQEEETNEVIVEEVESDGAGSPVMHDSKHTLQHAPFPTTSTTNNQNVTLNKMSNVTAPTEPSLEHPHNSPVDGSVTSLTQTTTEEKAHTPVYNLQAQKERLLQDMQNIHSEKQRQQEQTALEGWHKENQYQQLHQTFTNHVLFAKAVAAEETLQQHQLLTSPIGAIPPAR